MRSMKAAVVALTGAGLVAAGATTALASSVTGSAVKPTTVRVVSAAVTTSLTSRPVTRLRLKLTTSGKALAGRSVTVKERATGTTTWAMVGKAASTVTDGTVLFAVPQTHASEQYEVTAAAVTGYAAGTSPVITVVLPAKAALTLTAATASVNATGLFKDTFTATLTKVGKPVAGVWVRLQYRDTAGAAWRWATVSKTGTAGKASWTVVQSVASRQYRALFSGNASAAATASAAVTVTKA
jgi:hypothetical protein